MPYAKMQWDVASSDDEDEDDAPHPRVTKLGAKGLTQDDYYQRSAEFRHWLLNSGTARKYRKDYGLSWNAALETGGILVGDDVNITIEAQFIKQLSVPGDQWSAKDNCRLGPSDR